MSVTDDLHVARDDRGVLHLRLHRPHKRNALTDEIVAALIAEVTAAGQDEAVRAILLDGAGEHFCSGFDIVARNSDTGDHRPRVGSIQRRLPEQANRLIDVLVTTQVPIVVAARGWVAGIGLHLLLAADVALVSRGATLWEPFAARGFTPDSGGTWLLPRRVGEIRARRMLLLGERIDGGEAHAWGMVHAVVDDAELDAEADRVVAQLAAGPTVTLGLTKALLHHSSARDLRAQMHDEALALELSSRSEDFREGLRAFAEKRPARFTGR